MESLSLRVPRPDANNREIARQSRDMDGGSIVLIVFCRTCAYLPQLNQ